MAADLPEPNGIDAAPELHAPEEPVRSQRPRTSASTIDSTITHPGSVKINVQGAFIVDEDSALANGTAEDGARHETTDIRLPNHTAVVSHVAVDVRIRGSP
jgi:type II pantothenate kinase